MAIIAVAGGTGGLGRAIVEAIKARNQHDVKILSRKANPHVESEIIAPVIIVDYSDVDNLTRALEDNKVDTLVSTLSSMLSEGESPEINLIRAADLSSCTKRFIPSNWGIPYTEKHQKLLPTVSTKLQSLSELERSSLEYTVFYNGFFLDYYGIPSVNTYLPPFTMVVDVVNNVAAIPGFGNTPMVFTHTFDIASFVAASLDLEKWERESYVVGDRVTWNGFVELAEAATGTKFKITYDSIESLKKGQVTVLPSHTSAFEFIPKESLLALFAAFGQLSEDGSWDLKPQKTLNEIFPEIKPLKVKDVLEAVAKNG